MGQTITLKKISKQLNLSISTISRALKDHPDISIKTREKVKELAALMEYEPNSYAVNLRTNKSNVLGLIVPAIANLFNDSFIAAVEHDARKSGYSLLILQSGDDPAMEVENLKLCRHYRVDGIFLSLVANSNSSALLTKYKETGIPIVFFDRVPDTENFDTVCMDDEAAATMAANIIIKYKKKNILALFGNPDLSITKKREVTFLKILKKQSAVTTSLNYCSNSEDAFRLTNKAFKKTALPDHIFCMSDEILIGAMKAIKNAGLKIPGDISILAISNGFIPQLFNPEINFIETSGKDLGSLSIKRMLANIENDKPPAAFILPVKYIKGGSL